LLTSSRVKRTARRVPPFEAVTAGNTVSLRTRAALCEGGIKSGMKQIDAVKPNLVTSPRVQNVKRGGEYRVGR